MHKDPLSRNVSGDESPARRVIRVFGAARAGAIVNLTTDALRKWDRPMPQGGGGLVPARYQKLYLDEAARLGLALTAADLIAEPVENIRVREDVQ